MNKNDIKPDDIAEEVKAVAAPVAKPVDFKNVDGQDSLNRFDKKKNPNQKQGGQKKKPYRNNSNRNNNNRNNNNRPRPQGGGDKKK